MRFEQQTEAKRHAAGSVAELSVTRPGAEGLKLALEAGGLVVGMWKLDIEDASSTAFDSVLLRLLDNTVNMGGADARPVLVIPVKHLQKMDHAEASKSLAELLLGDNPAEQTYALQLLARMHDQLSEKEDGWQASFDALSELSVSGDEKIQVYARTVLAACTPDGDDAVRALVEADVTHASYVNLFCWFEVAKHRKLDIPEDTQLRWLGEYVLKIPPGDISNLNGTITEPTVGPLRGVNWKKPSSHQRDVASLAVERLINVLRKETIRTDLTPEQERDVSGHSLTLCHVIDHVSLSQPVKDAALTVLNLRLKRLLELRDRPESSILEWLVDTPSQVAVAITLLSGHAPESLTTSTARGDRKFSELQILTKMATDPQSAFRNNFFRQSTTSKPMFEWYPYQALQRFADLDALRLAKGTSRSKPLSGSTLIGMYAQSNRIVVHPVLAVDYIANLTTTDATSTAIVKTFSTSLAQPKQLVNYVQRHPAFAKRVSAWADQSVTHEAIHASVRILEAAQPADVLKEKMHKWVSSDDDQRAQYAVNKFWEPDFVDDRKKWGREIATAIARHTGVRKSFKPEDVRNLDDLGEDAEPAIDELVGYVKIHILMLRNMVKVTGSTVVLDDGTQVELQSIILPLKVLSRFPERSQVLRSDVEKALRFSDESTEFKLTDRNEAALLEFLKALDAAEPESAP